MTLREEHTLRRQFLQRLGSTYVYERDVLDLDIVHQPVHLTARQPVVESVVPESRPSALAFALKYFDESS